MAYERSSTLQKWGKERSKLRERIIGILTHEGDQLFNHFLMKEEFHTISLNKKNMKHKKCIINSVISCEESNLNGIQ